MVSSLKDPCAPPWSPQHFLAGVTDVSTSGPGLVFVGMTDKSGVIYMMINMWTIINATRTATENSKESEGEIYLERMLGVGFLRKLP